MAQWASGKIKRLYNGYDSFCQEIGNLLGEPTSKPRVSHQDTPEMIEEFEALWEKSGARENMQQLLTLLSNFYRAGFIIDSQNEKSQIQSYFLEDSFPMAASSILEKSYVRLTPTLPTKEDLKPKRLETHPILKTLGLPQLTWVESAETFHFWLYPENQTSLLLITDLPEPTRKEVVLKTQALIQRRFYDSV